MTFDELKRELEKPFGEADVEKVHRWVREASNPPPRKPVKTNVVSREEFDRLLKLYGLDEGEA